MRHVDPTPTHYCADADFRLIRPDDPEMQHCRCTFKREAEEAARASGWRPAIDLNTGWHLRLGGARLWLDDHGVVCGVEVDDPPMESTLLRDAITQMHHVVASYVQLYHVAVFCGSTKGHFVNYVAEALNARIAGRLKK